MMSGSLGQGLSQAVGIALARQRKGHSGRNWVFMSDDERAGFYNRLEAYFASAEE